MSEIRPISEWNEQELQEAKAFNKCSLEELKECVGDFRKLKELLEKKMYLERKKENG